MIIEVTEDEAIALFNLIYCTVPTACEMWERLRPLYNAMVNENFPTVESVYTNVSDMHDIPRVEERRVVSESLPHIERAA